VGSEWFAARQGCIWLQLDHDATDNAKMRGGEERVDPPNNGVRSVEDFSFVVFSLTHAECGEEGVIELRLGERWLLGWCPSCAALETFGSPG
jgi:hypothetical protein